METIKFQELTNEELSVVNGGGLVGYLAEKLIDAIVDIVEKTLKDLAGPNI